MALIVVRDLRGAIVVRLSLNGSVGGRFCTKLPFWWLLTLYPEHLLPDMLSQSPRLPIKQNIEGRRKSDINPQKKGIFLQIKTLSRKCRDKSAIKAHLILSGTWRDCYSTAEIARGDRRSAHASLFPRPLAPLPTLYLQSHQRGKLKRKENVWNVFLNVARQNLMHSAACLSSSLLPDLGNNGIFVTIGKKR